MVDPIGRDEPIGEPGRERHTPEPVASSPHARDETLPGNPREAQEPQEPRSTHIDPEEELSRDRSEGMHTHGRTGGPTDDEARREEQRGVVDELRNVWDRIRGK
jgi:hypothetical protein